LLALALFARGPAAEARAGQQRPASVAAPLPAPAPTSGLPDPLAERGVHEAAASALLGPAAPETVAAIHAELEGVEGAAFRQRVAELLAEEPRASLRALFLRAGSDDPPGVTGARAERRARRRDEALAWLAEDRTAGGPSTAELRDVLALADFGPGDEDLLCAATRAAARGKLYGLATDLAWNLGDARPARVREAARLALRELFGRWMTAERFEELWPRLRGKGPDELFLDDLRRLDREERSLFEAVVAYEPERAAAAFADAPPERRALAARGLVRAVGQKRLDVPSALARLCEQLAREVDPLAFQAEIDAALELVQGQAAQSDAVTKLRGVLTAEALLAHEHLGGALAQALGRLPWDGDAARPETSIDRGLSLVAERLAALGRPERPVDYDRFSVALEGLRALVGRQSLAPERVRAAVAPAREVVLDLALGEAGPLEARLDAARAIDDFLRVDDLPRVLALLGPDGALPALQTNLLVPLARLAPALDPVSDLSSRVVGALCEASLALDVDLRARALGLLELAELAPHVSARGASVVPRALLAGLSSGNNARNQVARLGLLARFGPNPDLAARLLDVPTFDVLVDGSERGRMSLVDALLALAGGDTATLVRAARRLARDARAVPPADAAGPAARASLALRALSGCGAVVLDRLAGSDRLEAVRWALRVREAGSSVPSELLARLAGPWLAPDGVDLLTPFERDWARALFGGDQFLAAPAPREPAGREPVLSAYARALAAAEGGQGPGGWTPYRVRLARARFLVAAGEWKGAAPDFAAFLSGSSEAEAEAVRLLGLSDLRAAARSLATTDSVLAARAGLRVVGHPEWGSSAREERLADLELLVNTSLSGGDAQLVAEVRALFASLPAPVPQGTPPAGTGIFERLLSQPGAHQALWALAERLAASPRAAPAADPPPDKGRPGSL